MGRVRGSSCRGLVELGGAQEVGGDGRLCAWKGRGGRQYRRKGGGGAYA